MSQLLSIKSAAILFVATVAMCFSGLEEANAQCGGRGGIGYAPNYSRNVGYNYNSGYRGVGYGGGFNNGYSNFNRGSSLSINVGGGRSGFGSPYYGNNFGRSGYNNFNSYSRSRFGY